MSAALSRAEIASAAAASLRAWTAETTGRHVTLGLDGFVDQIIAVVEKRYNSSQFDTVPTIARLSDKLRDAVGQSANYELLIRQQ